jgi:hypothetical protein
MFSGTFDDTTSAQHSNERELLAVALAIKGARLANTSIKVFSDNTSVVAIINRQGTIQSRRLQNIAAPLFNSLQEDNVHILAAHIPGILNIHADMLSRQDQVFSTEWGLDPIVFASICSHFAFQPKIDAFATAINTQLPLYFSPVPDERAAGLDAMAQSWNGWELYIFPPFAMYSQVLTKLRSSRSTTAIVVYPSQPRKAWFPGLTDLMTCPPLRLPLQSHILRQPHSKPRHSALRVLNLHAALCVSPTL